MQVTNAEILEVAVVHFIGLVSVKAGSWFPRPLRLWGFSPLFADVSIFAERLLPRAEADAVGLGVWWGHELADGVEQRPDMTVMAFQFALQLRQLLTELRMSR